jgi:hypothetical protein
MGLGSVSFVRLDTVSSGSPNLTHNSFLDHPQDAQNDQSSAKNVQNIICNAQNAVLSVPYSCQFTNNVPDSSSTSPLSSDSVQTLTSTSRYNLTGTFTDI